MPNEENGTENDILISFPDHEMDDDYHQRHYEKNYGDIVDVKSKRSEYENGFIKTSLEEENIPSFPDTISSLIRLQGNAMNRDRREKSRMNHLFRDRKAGQNRLNHFLRDRKNQNRQMMHFLRDRKNQNRMNHFLRDRKSADQNRTQNHFLRDRRSNTTNNLIRRVRTDRTKNHLLRDRRATRNRSLNHFLRDRKMCCIEKEASESSDDAEHIN